jgi:excisionase family DNA binding protein
MPILNDYVDVVEAGGILHVHWETVKRLCREGQIPAQKVHNKWLIHKDDISEFAKTYDAHRGLKNRNRNTGRA